MNPIAGGILSAIYGTGNKPKNPWEAVAGTRDASQAHPDSSQPPAPAKTPVARWTPLSMIFGMGK